MGTSVAGVSVWLNALLSKEAGSIVPQMAFFKIKDGISDPDKIIADRNTLKHSNVKVGQARIGDLYLNRMDRKEPGWLGYFGDSIDLAGFSLRTSSLAALMLVQSKESLYAVVFGNGRYLLRDGVVEHRFGLRATLNAVEPSQLRSIDHKRLEAVSRHTREQLSKAGGLDQFGLDVDRDLLGAVTGTPADSKYGRRLSGADQLAVAADIPLATLPTSLAMYGELADKTTYIKNFPWVDNVREVRDEVLISALDKQLAKDLAKGKDYWLAPPEIIDWNATQGFQYSKRKKAVLYDDLELEDYYSEYGSPKGLTEARMTQDRIYYVRSDDGVGHPSWSFISCLVGECHYKKKRYILNEGRWYEIDENFLQTIEEFTKNIPSSNLNLPRFADANEGAYNKRAASLNKDDFALLDQNFINYPPRGRVEVCDIYTKERTFIHVKKCGASSTLSHLFSQGIVSAQLMVSEPGFRYQFQKKIPQNYHWGDPAEAIKAADFEVCYAIVTRPKKSLSLPFFSKISLKSAVQNLRQLGFRVSLAEIPA